MGYRKKIMGDVDWRMQINVRNIHNWDNTDMDVFRFQPDGLMPGHVSLLRDRSGSLTFRF